MLKFLIGGSPCTHWSIAQQSGRETTASGEGWELFFNFVIAKERFKPDFFLYENNKSAAKEIKAQISKELGAPLQYINSALVSAQNRERFYCHNFGDVPQPDDRGIILQNILQSEAGTQIYPFGNTKGKSYCLTSNYSNTPYPEHTLKKSARTMAAAKVEPIADREKGECLRATYYKSGMRNFEKKITDGMGYWGVPVRVGTIENKAKNQEKHDSKPYRVYSPEGKSTTLCSGRGSAGTSTGLYAVPSLPTIEGKPVYRVEAGQIEIKGKQYQIKLPDGFYIIRKLTVTECCRLQTLPDDYCRDASQTQAYKGLGNGWTAEVIIHLLAHALKGVPHDTPLLVLSMYDGIGTGRYCFDRLGYNNITYYSYEIDEHAKRIAMSNYQDIKQCGDAFAVRESEWFLRSASKKGHSGSLRKKSK
ncbi:MAG: DNA cytosine methyltransferase [Oscillospiraceae bacterium]|nr:DNA cytosine methyltransferase [Oscillospiraceae bacterium]